MPVLPAGWLVVPPERFPALHDALVTAVGAAWAAGEQPDRAVTLTAYELEQALQAIGTGPVPIGSDVVPIDGTDEQEGGAWISVQEAAAIAQITDRAVRKAIAAGRVEARMEGGRWMVQTSSAEALRRRPA